MNFPPKTEAAIQDLATHLQVRHPVAVVGVALAVLEATLDALTTGQPNQIGEGELTLEALRSTARRMETNAKAAES